MPQRAASGGRKNRIMRHASTSQGHPRSLDQLSQHAAPDSCDTIVVHYVQSLLRLQLEKCISGRTCRGSHPLQLGSHLLMQQMRPAACCSGPHPMLKILAPLVERRWSCQALLRSSRSLQPCSLDYFSLPPLQEPRVKIQSNTQK